MQSVLDLCSFICQSKELGIAVPSGLGAEIDALNDAFRVVGCANDGAEVSTFCVSRAFESEKKMMSCLSDLVAMRSGCDVPWRFLSAWTQQVEYTYNMQLAISIAELQKGAAAGNTITNKPIRTLVETTLSGLKISHSEICTHHTFAFTTRADTPQSKTSSSPWKTKFDAANTISNLMVGWFRGSKGLASPKDVCDIMTWLQKENIDTSPKFKAHCEEMPQSTCELFPSSLLRTRPIASTALPSTVKLTSCVVRFVKTLYPDEGACNQAFKVTFVIEGSGQTHAEAEQNVWQKPACFMRIEFGVGLLCSNVSVDVLEGLLCSRPLVLCGSGSPTVRAMHTLSYLFEQENAAHESPTDFIAHAANYLKGCYVSDSSDIFTHWGILYSGNPAPNPVQHKLVNTSGGMPRVFQVSHPYTLRPKLIQVSQPVDPLLLLLDNGSCCPSVAAGEFLEECLRLEVARSAGIAAAAAADGDLDPLGLERGISELGEVADDRGPRVVHGHAAREEGCDVDACE